MFGIGFQELIVLFILFGIPLTLYFVLKKEKINKDELKIKWLNFYTYFLLPLIIILTVVRIFELENWILKLIDYIFIAIAITGIVGIYKRKKWGWNINIFFIFLNCLFFSVKTGHNVSNYQIVFNLFITLIIWFIPNYIYFRKRLNLFS